LKLELITISLSLSEEPDFLWKGIKIIASVDGSAQHRSVY